MVDSERLDDLSSATWVRPGLVGVVDKHSRVPGTPRLLTASERQRIGHSLLVVG